MVLNRVYIHGCGAVSPAGWGVPQLREAMRQGIGIQPTEIPRPGLNEPLKVRTVPPAHPRPSFFAHPRLRRTSPIAQYCVGAALEALGSDTAQLGDKPFSLGIVFCAMSGCVTFSRRFCDEMLNDPSTASPVLFPETVFNAPASHLAALLGTRALYYTLVGDPGVFLQGVALAADWLLTGKVDSCLVIGAEERDWLVAEAFQLFDHAGILGEGAGALYLRREASPGQSIELKAITRPHLFFRHSERPGSAARARAELGPDASNAVLCDGRVGVRRLDEAEEQAWQNWSGPRLSPKIVCGEGLMAAAAWQCVAAVDALAYSDFGAANVSVVGINEQAIAGQFVKGGTSA